MLKIRGKAEGGIIKETEKDQDWERRKLASSAIGKKNIVGIDTDSAEESQYSRIGEDTRKWRRNTERFCTLERKLRRLWNRQNSCAVTRTLLCYVLSNWKIIGAWSHIIPANPLLDVYLVGVYSVMNRSISTALVMKFKKKTENNPTIFSQKMNNQVTI